MEVNRMKIIKTILAQITDRLIQKEQYRQMIAQADEDMQESE